ncbi:MAG: PorT family protein [Bacteroidales bacterium]|jgi:hypothetical protein|nr:PorT family protein [Bacteroidales bacterium]
MERYKKIGKAVIIWSFICLFCGSLFAQKGAPNLPNYDTKIAHFGFVLGINCAGFSSKPVSNLNPLDSVMFIQSAWKPGFDIGILANLHLGRCFDLRFIPSLSLLDRTINYSISHTNSGIYEHAQRIESVNLNLPLLIRLKSSRVGNNIRFYAITGVQYSIDLASRSKKRIADESNIIKLRMDDLQVQVGTGLDFYLQFFKFSMEAKMSFGVLNLMEPTNTIYSTSVEYLRSTTFHISFLFEG